MVDVGKELGCVRDPSLAVGERRVEELLVDR